MIEPASSERISLRKYRPDDRPRCLKIMAQAWPSLTIDRFDSLSMDWYSRLATWKKVACVTETPVGVIFGNVYHNLGARDSLKTSIAHLTIYMRMLLGIYGKIPHCLALIKGAMADERNISKNSREVDGEIGLLVVDSTHRRMGIGRQLIDSFLGHAKKKGARKISVYTIDPGSDWRFYEHYGFRKYSSFRDNFMSLVQNEEVKGIIYVFDIGRRESSRFQE